MKEKYYFAFLILLMAGCASNSEKDDPNYFSHISSGIKERTDYSLKQEPESGQFEVPEWITFDDGLSQDEAVSLALWNNSRFQYDLASLGFVRADLLEANMLNNPVFSILFPVSPKLLETSLDIPVDILWQKPHRVAVAKLEAQKLAENLIVNGLGLIKDVQIAYTNLSFIQEYVNLTTEEAQLRKAIVELDQARIKTGEISELIAKKSYIGLVQTEDTLTNSMRQIDISEQKMFNLLGATPEELEFEIVTSDIMPISSESLENMLRTAFLCRPDLRAAELAIEAAGENVGWEKSKVYNFIAILDGDNTETDSFTVRPGFAVGIPIFNRNEAKIARAEAELEQAARNYEAIRRDIIHEVTKNYTQYISIHEQLNTLNNNIIPSFELVHEQTKKTYQAGDVSSISVLNSQADLLEARKKLIELIAKLNICIAELNYSIGKKMI